jgi:hypothetical protein
MNTQICKNCEFSKSIDKFPLTSSGYRRKTCSACLSARFREQNPEARKRITQKSKEAYNKRIPFYKIKLMQEIGQTSCKDCGFDDYRAIHFHHRDKATKKFSISWALVHHYGFENLLEEAKKCDVLCPNCHRLEHFNNHKPYSRGFTRSMKALEAKTDLIKQLELEIKCQSCDLKDIRVLGFRHKYQTERCFDLNNIWNNDMKLPWDLIKEEAKKCDVLCLTCGLVKQAEERGTYGQIAG